MQFGHLIPCPEAEGALGLGFQPHNRSPSRRRARYRALIVGGQKRVTLGNKRERRRQQGAFAEIQGIDNEHD